MEEIIKNTDNIIYEKIEELKELGILLEKQLETGVYFLLLDDEYFEELDKSRNMNREIYTIAKSKIESLGVLKYIAFNTKNLRKIEEIYQLNILIKEIVTNIVTIFNMKKNICTILFTSTKDDKKLIKLINDFLEVEGE